MEFVQLKSQMPLTKKGKLALRRFKKQYNRTGLSVFYAYMKKYPKRTKTWHKIK